MEGFYLSLFFLTERYGKIGASQVAYWYGIHLAMQDMRFRFLGWEDYLEEKMSTHSSILAWEIPWTVEPGGLYSPWGIKELDMT